MRMFPINKSPIKNQELSVTLKDKNGKDRTWLICSEGQLEWVKKQAKEQFHLQAYDGNIKEADKYVEEKMKDYEETCEYITLDKALSMMSPAQRTQWENWYRFTPISISSKS